MEMVKMFEKPKKQYMKFCKAIRQDMETKSFKTFTFRLNCFIDLLCSEDISKETATMKIEEFVDQGMVEKMLWEAFVNLISQPISPTITSAMVALLQTLHNIIDNSISTAKAQVCVFLPYLIRDVIGYERNEHRVRIEGTKLINNLLEQNSLELREQTEKLKSLKTIHDDIGTIISNAADFELQAQLLEMVFRLVPASERIECLYSWFESEDLQNLFLCIEDKSFEPGCRKFLNKLNENKKGVFSIPCQMILFGSQQITLAKDVESGNQWLDFNFGSKTLKFFLEEKEETPSENEDDDIWWRTVTIELDNVVDCNLFEQQDCITLKITLKENVTSLIPSWSPTDIHVIQIKFASDCDIHKLREVLESFSWIRPDRLSSSPKASVAIFSVHLADRQKGQMTVVPTIDSKPPKTLMEEDSIEDEVLVNNSDITASLDGKGMEESEELLPAEDTPQEPLENVQTTSTESQEYAAEKTDELNLEPTDSQELKADYSSRDANDNVDHMTLRALNAKAPDDDHLEENKPAIDKQDMDKNINPVVEADDLNEAEDTIKDKYTEDNLGKEKQKRRARDKSKETSTSTPPKKKSRSNDDSEGGTESSSSRRSSRRNPSGQASNKRTKSPLPVEIIKSDRRKSSSSSGKSSTESEEERKSSEPKKPKTYPSVFNIDKRMQAKKNNAISNGSQEIKNKVFGHRGSSFGQKTSLHIMAPARRADHFKKRKSSTLEDKHSSKKNSQNKNTKAKEHSDSDQTSREDNEKEVIQDSFPLEDSPEVPSSSRRRSDVTKATETKVTDERLTRSEPSTRTKQRVQFVNDKTIPTRLGTILRKGDKKDRDSLLDESTRSGWGSTSTSSTSETDWPGPDVEPGPKAKHSLVPCKSVREKRLTRNTASQKGIKKRASISPGLSAISEEKSPIEIQLDDDTPQATRAQVQNKPAKSSDSRTKKRGREVDVFGDNEKPQESGNTSEDTLVYGETLLYESTSNRKTRSDAKTSDKLKASRSKKVDTAKQRNKHSTAISSNKTKEKQDKIDFEQEFDFDLPNLTVLAAEDSFVGENVGREGAALPSSHKSRDKSTSRMPLDDDNNDGKEDDVVYTQDTTVGSRDKPQNVSHVRTSDRKRIEEDFDHVFYHEDTTNKKESKSLKNSHSKQDDLKKLRQKLFKRGFSEDEIDEESDLPNEYKSPKRRRTYGKKQRQKYSTTLEEDWMKDKDTENKKRATDVSRMGWQPSSRKGASKTTAQKSLSRPSNRSDEELKSGYEIDDHHPDPPAYDQRFTEAYLDKRQETRNPRSRKTKREHQDGREQPKSLSKQKNRVEDMEEEEDEEANEVINPRSRKTRGEQPKAISKQKNRVEEVEEEDEEANEVINPRSRKTRGEQPKALSKPKNRVDDMEEDEETNEVLNLRRFCQDITTSESSTPTSKLPLRKRRDEETEDGKPIQRLKCSKIQGKSNGLQISDHSGKASPKHSKHHDEKVENFAGHNVSRSRANTNERFGERQVNTSNHKTPSTTQGRLTDSGLGGSIGTGSHRRTSVTSSTASTTPKGRRKGELRVTTSISKTPVTPRTSAIMRRIDEEEDLGHSKKPRQFFVDWTSSGPSRTVSTPYQEAYSPDINIDDHQDREQKRAHERLKGKGDHNPNVRPRQLFRQVVNEPSPEEEEDREDEMHYDQSSTREDVRDISDMLSGLQGSLTERLRRKRQNLQRFCKRTMDVTIETMNRHFEQNLTNRDKMIDSFNDQFLEEIKILKDEMEKAKKTEEQILARIEEDIKILKTRRILQENKIKGLRNLCVEFQSEMIKGSDSQSVPQDAFEDEIRQELVHIQEHFLLEAQRQDRENLRRSLRSVLDATTM